MIVINAAYGCIQWITSGLTHKSIVEATHWLMLLLYSSFLSGVRVAGDAAALGAANFGMSLFFTALGIMLGDLAHDSLTGWAKKVDGWLEKLAAAWLVLRIARDSMVPAQGDSALSTYNDLYQRLADVQYTYVLFVYALQEGQGMAHEHQNLRTPASLSHSVPSPHADLPDNVHCERIWPSRRF